MNFLWLLCERGSHRAGTEARRRVRTGSSQGPGGGLEMLEIGVRVGIDMFWWLIGWEDRLNGDRGKLQVSGFDTGGGQGEEHPLTVPHTHAHSPSSP